MTFVNDYDSFANVTGGFLSAAKENATRGGDIAIISAEVIAKRVALGMAASFHPLEADYAEFLWIVPEKVEAFATAGTVMLEYSTRANRHMILSASEEIVTATIATIEMTDFSNPAILAEAQGTFVRAWFARTTSIWIAMGLHAFGAQAAAMEPVRQTVLANAERLNR